MIIEPTAGQVAPSTGRHVPAQKLSQERFLGITRAELRDRLLKSAGIDDPERVRLLRLAIDKYVEKLEAKKAGTVVYRDGEPEIVEYADHLAQLRAADALTNLVDALPSKESSSQNSKLIVEIVLPDWAKPVEVVTNQESVIGGEVVDIAEQ